MGRQKWTAHRLAQALGVSDGLVSRYRKAGMPLDLTGATAWRLAHVDEKYAPTPRAAPDAATVAGDSALKTRKLAAVVTILEDKARNAGGVSLPSIHVEKAIIVGLQLLRSSITSSAGAMYGDFAAALGDDGARKLLGMVEDWWAGVHDAAADAILRGLVRELPVWGRDFRGRYVALHRGNFPDVPFPGEPRTHD